MDFGIRKSGTKPGQKWDESGIKPGGKRDGSGAEAGCKGEKVGGGSGVEDRGWKMENRGAQRRGGGASTDGWVRVAAATKTRHSIPRFWALWMLYVFWMRL